MIFNLNLVTRIDAMKCAHELTKAKLLSGNRSSYKELFKENLLYVFSIIRDNENEQYTKDLDLISQEIVINKTVSDLKVCIHAITEKTLNICNSVGKILLTYKKGFNGLHLYSKVVDVEDLPCWITNQKQLSNLVQYLQVELK